MVIIYVSDRPTKLLKTIFVISRFVLAQTASFMVGICDVFWALLVAKSALTKRILIFQVPLEGRFLYVPRLRSFFAFLRERVASRLNDKYVKAHAICF